MANFLDLPERMRNKIAFAFNTGCWVWTGAHTNHPKRPYGIMRINRRNITAHRVAYTLLIGEIPLGLDVHHDCRNTLCCNPEHLHPVTRKVNLNIGFKPGPAHHKKTHCKHGHEFTPENTGTYKRYERGGGRYCKQCACDRQKKLYWKTR